jgi:hypothetical protein
MRMVDSRSRFYRLVRPLVEYCLAQRNIEEYCGAIGNFLWRAEDVSLDGARIGLDCCAMPELAGGRGSAASSAQARLALYRHSPRRSRLSSLANVKI